MGLQGLPVTQRILSIDAKYPYLLNQNQLPGNFYAVKAVLYSTLRRLERDYS